jgi:hypothetical protein
VTAFLAAQSLDTGAGDALTVILEGSPDGTRWDTIDDSQGNPVSLSEGDLDDDPDSGDSTASLTHRGAYYEFYRLRVTNYNDAGGGDLALDGWVMAAGNAGSGTRGQPDGP